MESGVKMADTYDNLATFTGTTAVSEINFTSINSTYTDLRLIIVGASNSTGAGSVNINVEFNNDQTTAYSRVVMTGNGTVMGQLNGTTTATSLYCGNLPDKGTPSVQQGMAIIDIFNYTAAIPKTLLSQNDFVQTNNGGQVRLICGLWNNTAAINKIRIFEAGGSNYNNYTFTLYGIKRA